MKRKRRSVEEIAAEKLAKAERKAVAEAKARQRRTEEGARMSKAAAKGYEASLAKDRARTEAKARSEGMMDFALGKDTPEARKVGETIAKVRASKGQGRKRRGAKPAFVPSAEKRELGTRQVVDPYEPMKHISATVNVAESPLEHLAARGMIDVAQLSAGNRFRRLYETIGIGGAKAIDYEKAKVDGGKINDPIRESVHEAAIELKAVAAVLGQADYALVVKVIGEGHAIKDVTPWWHSKTKVSVTEQDEKYVGKRVRDALTHLAAHWQMDARARTRHRESA